MKSLRFTTLVMVALVVTTSLFAADFGVRAGRYNDSEEEFVGAELLFDLGALNINPNIEYSLEEDVTAATVNLDVTATIGTFGAASPFVGAGVGMLYADDDFQEARTDVLGNLIAGVAFELDFLQPYAQVKYFRLLEDDRDDSDEFALTVGVRF